jgi:hypothetical protein
MFLRRAKLSNIHMVGGGGGEGISRTGSFAYPERTILILKTQYGMFILYPYIFNLLVGMEILSVVLVKFRNLHGERPQKRKNWKC